MVKVLVISLPLLRALLEMNIQTYHLILGHVIGDEQQIRPPVLEARLPDVANQLLVKQRPRAEQFRPQHNEADHAHGGRRKAKPAKKNVDYEGH